MPCLTSARLNACGSGRHCGSSVCSHTHPHTHTKAGRRPSDQAARAYLYGCRRPCHSLRAPSRHPAPHTPATHATPPAPSAPPHPLALPQPPSPTHRPPFGLVPLVHTPTPPSPHLPVPVPAARPAPAVAVPAAAPLASPVCVGGWVGGCVGVWVCVRVRVGGVSVCLEEFTYATRDGLGGERWSLTHLPYLLSRSRLRSRPLWPWQHNTQKGAGLITYA
jgi:hypothetical protein